MGVVATVVLLLVVAFTVLILTRGRAVSGDNRPSTPPEGPVPEPDVLPDESRYSPGMLWRAPSGVIYRLGDDMCWRAERGA